MIVEVIKVIFKADFNIVFELVTLDAIFWFTTVEIENDDNDNINVNVGSIIDTILMPSKVRILDSKNL